MDAYGQAVMQGARGLAGNTQAPGPPVDITVGNLVTLIGQQVQELQQRAVSIADHIAGPQPPVPGQDKPESPSNLVAALKMISQALTLTLSDTERIQRTL